MSFRIATIALAVGGLAVAGCGGSSATIAEENRETENASASTAGGQDSKPAQDPRKSEAAKVPSGVLPAESERRPQVTEDDTARPSAGDSSEKERVDRLAKKWYGEKTTIEEVRKWKGLRITAEAYNTPGGPEMRWLLLLSDNKVGPYSGVVVPMAIGSSRNKSIRMPDEMRERLRSISKYTAVSGVSEEKELNDLVLPYLLQTHGEKSDIWTKGSYHYVPVKEVREYLLKLAPDEANPHWIPQAASVYVDEDGVVIHHKVTDVLTVSF